MLLNPELRRNIWLDFSIQRLILTPLIIGLILYWVYSLSGALKSAEIALYLAYFFIFLWGTKDSSDTVIEEINNGTWDFQRQSTLTPWSMAWGKLLGSTLFSWYGAGLCLLLYIIFQWDGSLILLRNVLLLILCGVFTQALTLLFSLQSLSLVRSQKNNKSFRYYFAGTFIGVIFTALIFDILELPPVIWHKFSIPGNIFAILSVIIFLGWALLGLQRSFCRELQYQKTPWVWALFTIFCMIYFSGFEPYPPPKNINEARQVAFFIRVLTSTLFGYIPFFIAALLTYVALFNDSLNTVKYKKIFARFSEKNYLEVLKQLPLWSISYIITIAAGIFATKNVININEGMFDNFNLIIFIVTSLLFLLRDILLANYFYFTNGRKSTVATIIIYLFLAYCLIPLILIILNLKSLSPMFLPSYGQNTPLAFASLLIQIAFLGWLCWKKYHMVEKISLADNKA